MTKIPYAIGSDTSRDAARNQRGKTKRDMQRIYDLLLQTPGGLTTDEIRIKTGMLASTAGARRRDLEQIGGCRRTNERRRTSTANLAYVYVAVEGVDIDKPKRIGRPKKDKKNNVKLSVYVSPDLYNALMGAVEFADTTASVYVRRLLEEDLAERRRNQELSRQMELGMRMGRALDILGGE